MRGVGRSPIRRARWGAVGCSDSPKVERRLPNVLLGVTTTSPGRADALARDATESRRDRTALESVGSVRDFVSDFFSGAFSGAFFDAEGRSSTARERVGAAFAAPAASFVIAVRAGPGVTELAVAAGGLTRGISADGEANAVV